MSDAQDTSLEQRMSDAGDAMERDFNTIRTGRASTAIVERVQVDYYGTMTPLNQLASISVPEASLVVIQPWDRGVLGAIDKAIQKSEFRDLLEFVVLFSGMRKVFAKMDTSADGRVDRREFFASCRKLPRGKQLGDDDLDLAFVAIDRDGGGEIRFSELCEWAAFNHRLEPRAAAAGGAATTRGGRF